MNQPLAYVHPGAKIAKNVVIEPFSTIHNNVVVGEGTWIASNVTVMEGARIGKNCSIFPGSVISAPPQDLKYRDEKTCLEVGEGTTIREYATLNRGTTHTGKTVVGRNCLLMAYVHVAHDCVIGNEVIISNAVNMAGHVVIEDSAGIGGMTAIHQFVRIGRHSFIGGGFRVAKDVPPYILAMGEPLQYGGVNHIGLSRKGYSSEVLLEIKRAYRLIYRSNLTKNDALVKIREELKPFPEIDHVVRFLEESERGLIKG